MDFVAWIAWVLDFIHQHPSLTWATVFVMAFFGEFIPLTWAAVVAIGSLAAVGDFLFSIVSAATVGSALADWLLYWLGRRFNSQIKQVWPFNRFPKFYESSLSLFRRRGALAFVFARISWPLRTGVPIAAGASNMPMARFQLLNWTSAALFSVVLLAPGALGVGWLLSHWG